MCDYSSRVHAYHDGELSPEHGVEVEAHLLSCSACAAELEQLRALSDLLQRGLEASMRPAALRRIHRSINVLSEGVILRLVGQLTAVAAVILVAGTLWISAHSIHSEQPVAPPSGWEQAAVTLSTDSVAYSGPDAQMAEWFSEPSRSN